MYPSLWDGTLLSYWLPLEQLALPDISYHLSQGSYLVHMCIVKKELIPFPNGRLYSVSDDKSNDVNNQTKKIKHDKSNDVNKQTNKENKTTQKV